MRSLVLVVGLLVACTNDAPSMHGWPQCTPPAGNCACFDGDYRCDPYPRCPIDLSLACQPMDQCGDLSGGSDGTDCTCTCGANGTWTCSRGGGSNETCIPM